MGATPTPDPFLARLAAGLVDGWLLLVMLGDWGRGLRAGSAGKGQ